MANDQAVLFSCDAHFAQTFVSGNGLDFSAAPFIPPAFRLGDPQLLDSPEIVSRKALHEKVREPSPRFARQRHRLFDQLLYVVAI